MAKTLFKQFSQWFQLGPEINGDKLKPSKGLEQETTE